MSIHGITTEIKKLENKMNRGRRRTHRKRRRTRRPRRKRTKRRRRVPKRTKRRRRRKRTKRRRKRKYQFGGLRFPITTAQWNNFERVHPHLTDCFACSVRFLGEGSAEFWNLVRQTNSGRGMSTDAVLEYFRRQIGSTVIDGVQIPIQYEWSRRIDDPILLAAAFEDITAGHGMLAFLGRRDGSMGHYVVFAKTLNNQHPILIDAQGPVGGNWYLGLDNIKKYLGQFNYVQLLLGRRVNGSEIVDLPIEIHLPHLRNSPLLATPAQLARKTPSPSALSATQHSSFDASALSAPPPPASAAAAPPARRRLELEEEEGEEEEKGEEEGQDERVSSLGNLFPAAEQARFTPDPLPPWQGDVADAATARAADAAARDAFALSAEREMRARGESSLGNAFPASPAAAAATSARPSPIFPQSQFNLGRVAATSARPTQMGPQPAGSNLATEDPWAGVTVPPTAQLWGIDN